MLSSEYHQPSCVSGTFSSSLSSSGFGVLGLVLGLVLYLTVIILPAVSELTLTSGISISGYFSVPFSLIGGNFQPLKKAFSLS